MFFCCVCEAVAKPRICKSDMIDYSSSIIFVPTSQCTPTIDAHPPTQPHTASTSTHTHARTHTHTKTHAPAEWIPLPEKFPRASDGLSVRDHRARIHQRLPHAPLYHPKLPSRKKEKLKMTPRAHPCPALVCPMRPSTTQNRPQGEEQTNDTSHK
jgi:hypothetical protein